MSRMLTGLLLGALSGAAAVMLLTPESGPDVKSKLRRGFGEIIDEGKRAASERRAELEAQFAEAKRTAR